jgi:hypothetical protein
MDIEQGYSQLSSMIFRRPRFETKEAFAAPTLLSHLVSDEIFVGLAIDAIEAHPTLHLLTRYGVAKEKVAKALSETSEFQFPIAVTHTGRFVSAIRPATGGDPVGHFRSASGTFGCTVQNQSGQTLILSCNHVLADVNRAVVGDAVLQPGVSHGGTPANRIGQLVAYIPLIADGQTPNLVDAAVALVDSDGDVIDGIRLIGRIKGTLPPPPPNATVFKQGATTAWTSGQIVFRKAEVTVTHDGVGDIVMSNQYGISGSSGVFSDRGDSGAIVVDANSRAIAMVIGIAEEANVTLATPIESVLQELKVTIR